jgi:arginase
MNKTGKIIDVIGVPNDFGANVRGASMGPAALRAAGLHEKLRSTGRKTRECGDIAVPYQHQITQEQAANHYLALLLSIGKELKQSCLASFVADHIPLVLGGDHSLAIGSLAATCEFYKDHQIGLLWIDAHADINTPASTLTGNIHGMPMSILLGNGYTELTQLSNNQKTIRPENIVYVGLRDLDAGEKAILKNSGITYFTMRDMDERGIRHIMQEICDYHFKDIEGLHVSFDLDAMNPQEVPGVSTPCPGGLSLREAHLIMELVYETQAIVAVDFVELNPLHDVRGQSAIISSDLICSLFGKVII